MDSQEDEIEFEFLPVFRVFKNGRVHRLLLTDRIPPSTDQLTGVQSKDFLIDPKTGVSVRLYLPKLSDSTKKLPLLIYIHGGAFSVGSPASPMFHNHLISLTAQANAVAVSVDYRLAPENNLPAAYEDAWTAVEWAASHSSLSGPEIWLNQHADFNRVFVVGESAGANISYNVMDRASENEDGVKVKGMKIIGLGLVHPYFMIDKPDKLIEYIFPTSAGLEDPRLNPKANPRVGKFGCSRVLICAAEIDPLKYWAVGVHAAFKESGFEGSVEMMETKGEDHGFHLFNPHTQNAQMLLTKIASFIQSPLS